MSTPPPFSAGPAPRPSPRPDALGSGEAAPAMPDVLASQSWPVVDWFIPSDVLRDEPDALRRMRLLVAGVCAAVPVFLLGIGQLVYAGPAYYGQAIGVAVAVVIFIVCPFLIRLTKTTTLPGTVFCLTLIGLQSYLSFTDAGLNDSTLFWAPVVPLLAAFIVGPRLALVSAALLIAEVSVLYWLERSGYVFPRLSDHNALAWFTLLTLVLSTAFAALMGWMYEGYTLKRLRQMNARLFGLKGALEQSEARYRALFENIPVGVYQSTPDGRVLMSNTALATMLGYGSTDAFATANMRDVYASPDGRQRFHETIARYGVVHQFESELVRLDGQTIHVLISARATFGDDGAVRYYEGTVEDVSAQRAAQDALHASEERFRALVQHSTDVITVIGTDGVITYQSPSVRQALGYAPAATVGRSMTDLVHPEDRRRARVLFQRALRHDGDFGTFEFRCLHADGHYVYVEAVGSNMLGSAEIGGIVLNSRDITERKRVEVALVQAKEQAEEMARMKSSFLANMSHEIRTPLTGILGFSGVLAEEVDEDQIEFVRLIERSGRRLLETLNSVLDLARLEADEIDVELVRCDVGYQAEDAVALFVPLAAEKGLELKTVVEAPGAEADLDSGCFNRVLNNLIGNAIKFTDEGGITVRVSADEDHVRLAVEDTGVGIDASFLPHLFEEFKQESTGFQRSHEGTGLGLTITRRLVELMGGALEVTSTKGEGSTFTAVFPTAAAESVAVDAIVQAAESFDLGRPRVLALDDNEGTRLLVGRLLADAFDVDTVANAVEAIARARDTAYDAVLMDIHLTEAASGVDVMEQLRALGGRLTPIIALTAFALPGDRERFLSAGFDGYLSKPFTKRQLLDTLGRALGGDAGPLDTTFAESDAIAEPGAAEPLD